METPTTDNGRANTFMIVAVVAMLALAVVVVGMEIMEMVWALKTEIAVLKVHAHSH